MRNLERMLLAALLAVPTATWMHDRPAAHEAKEAAIVGCKDTRIYHRPDCKWVKEIDKAGTRVDFASAQEAAKAGLKPCGDCKP